MFAEIKNGQVVNFPYDYDDHVRANPYTKFTQETLVEMYAGTEANLNGHELVRITEADMPTFDRKTQKVVQNSAPTLINNVWTLSWQVQSLTQDEQNAMVENQAKSVRATRNDKLKECDWTQISDAPVDKTAWAAYRQTLRDITAQSGFPWAVDWPDAP
jgi:hypothetical protein